MKITLPSEKTITTPKGKSLTATEFVIEKIIDIPSKKVVVAVVTGLGWVRVKNLCGKKYDAPQWTNETLAAHLYEQFSK